MHRTASLALCAVLFLGLIVAPAFADRRVALVIGNGAYAHAPHLPNPPHDAEDVAAALKRTGFDTILGIDLDQAGMKDPPDLPEPREFCMNLHEIASPDENPPCKGLAGRWVGLSVS
jgi:Caspase domain